MNSRAAQSKRTYLSFAIVTSLLSSAGVVSCVSLCCKVRKEMQNSQTKRQKLAQIREEKVISSLTQVPGRSCGCRIIFRGDGGILSVGFIQGR